MNIYRVSLVNLKTMARRVYDIKSCTCLDAIKQAKALVKGLGFTSIDYAYLIEVA